MARQRDPRRDELKKIWLDSNGKKKLKELANDFGISDSQIRKWKSIDKWSDELKSNVTNRKSNVTHRGGAPKGNQNALGNKGGGPKKHNKNAVKTGEYETIFADALNDEEKEIYLNLSNDPFFVMSEEVRLLQIRQRRMMLRIKEAEKGLNQVELEKLYELRGRKQYVDSEKGGRRVKIEVPNLVVTEMKEHSIRKIDDILAIEDALTRVSNQLQKATKQLNDLVMNKQRLALLIEKTKYTVAQTNEIGGASTNNEVEDWKQAVINAANKRAVEEDE